MAIDNLISISFSDEEIQKINNAIAQINEVLEGKAINLSPEERRQYGSIADRNKILVDKCKYYMDTNPETVPRTVDKAEFDADYNARKQVEDPLKKLSRVVEKLSDTKTLLDHDNFQASLTYYRYVKYLSRENEPGTTTIYQDIKKHYQTTGVSPQKDESKSSELPPETY